MLYMLFRSEAYDFVGLVYIRTRTREAYRGPVNKGVICWQRKNEKEKLYSFYTKLFIISCQVISKLLRLS